MIVRCNNIEDFTAICAAFVREGCTFDADATQLIITLTGGF